MADERRYKGTVAASEITAKIEKGEDVEYDNVIIKGNLDIIGRKLPTEDEKLVINSKISIINSRFDAFVDFPNVIFKKEIDFSGTIFHEKNDQGRSANFMSATFSGEADFSSTTFSGYAGFRSATFSGDAFFRSAIFGCNAFFIGANLNKKLDLDFSRIYSMHLSEVHLDQEFTISLRYSDFTWLRIPWELIYDHIKYDENTYDATCTALVKNYRNLNWPKDADQCYYQYRKTSQTTKNWYDPPNKLINALIRIHGTIVSHFQWVVDLYDRLNKIPPLLWVHRFDWSKLFDHLSWISCGYGLKIWPLVNWITGSILAFSYIYASFNIIGNTTSFVDNLYFSTFALAGRQPYGDMEPQGTGLYVVLLENLLGYVFLALFVVVLGRKIAR